MGEQTRWSLKVSRETDIALRTFLAERGGRKGDLSRFVEDAVNRAVLRQMVQDIWERNAGLAPEEVERLVDEELAEVRRARPDRFRRPAA
jgi:ribbon-helix-helix protein